MSPRSSRWLSPLVPSPCGQHLHTSFPLRQESRDLSAPISSQTLAYLLLVSAATRERALQGQGQGWTCGL